MKSGPCFNDFENLHKNETFLVAALGESISELGSESGAEALRSRRTIGVNDIGRAFHPDYLLNVNNRSQYKGDRFRFIETSQSAYCFTHVPEEQTGVKIPIVKFEIQKQAGGLEVVDGKVPHFRNSPYMAVALAAYMGARRIGLIGVDFTDNHFWIKDGPHRLNSEFADINAAYGRLGAHLRERGVELVNLSPISRIDTLPKESFQQWISRA